MGMDFSSLCLGPSMAIFGQPVMVAPVKSLPNAPAYPINGIFTITSVSIPTDDGGFLSSVALKLGIRMSDCPAAILQGDWISTAVGNLPLGYWQGTIDPTISLDFVVFDMTPDGQGGAVCILKRVLS
jgi:hypothetical protein